MACDYPLILIRDDPCLHVVPVPCGNCAGCRKDVIQMWSDRLSFETLTSKNPSTFLTLTFDDAHMPKNRSANIKHMQDFFKRLRYYHVDKRKFDNFRYFYTSEYGEQTYRLHYHAIITNLDGGVVETVEDISSAWADKYGNRLGIAQVGSLRPGGIGYVLDYMHDENPLQNKVYKALGLSPCVHGMSKGIGKAWILAHKEEIIKSNGYYSNGVLRPIPRYFEEKLGMIKKNEYVYRLNDIWEKYNLILKDKNIEPVDPFDINALKKRHLLDQQFPDSKMSKLQYLISDEGRELFTLGKKVFQSNADYSPSLGINTIFCA